MHQGILTKWHFNNAFRKQADEGKGILLITHDSHVEERADILYRMENGHLTEEKVG